MENKKTKLTISGKPKKIFKDFENKKSQGKNTVIIDKQTKTGNFHNPVSSKSSSSGFKRSYSKQVLAPKTLTGITDFERRKLAEQRATKRLKVDTEALISDTYLQVDTQLDTTAIYGQKY